MDNRGIGGSARLDVERLVIFALKLGIGAKRYNLQSGRY